MIFAIVMLFIFPPISWAIIYPLYNILNVSKALKLVRGGPMLAIKGFFIGFILMILGYLPAVIGGIYMLVKIF